MTPELTEDDLPPDPIALFERWFAEARAASTTEANAMTLATATADGRPSARVVLLKGVDARGFVFYTNEESRKGRELAANPRAALTLLWPALERQVRIAGQVVRVADEEADAYFASRPRGSQIGAWASEQSQPLADRGELERRWERLADRYEGVDVPRPPRWGGYRVEPDEIEFWQGRPNRLHDRFAYARAADGGWTWTRLQP